MTWRIYYDDGRTFGSEDGEWMDAPSDGVQYVVVFYSNRTEVFSGGDYYFRFEDGTIARIDDIGPLLRKFGVKCGRWTGNKTFEAIGRRVAEDLKRGS
jgi:hypothetical protein